MLRFSGGNARPSTPAITLNVTPDSPVPISTPARQDERQLGVVAMRHQDEAERVEQRAADDDASGAVLVGEHAGERLRRRPTRGSARRSRARTSRGPSAGPRSSAAGTARSRGGCPSPASGSMPPQTSTTVGVRQDGAASMESLQLPSDGEDSAAFADGDRRPVDGRVATAACGMQRFEVAERLDQRIELVDADALRRLPVCARCPVRLRRSQRRRCPAR